METLTFTLTDFEGPLDLLLALVSKNKMNIYDIRIVELIDQYLIVVNHKSNKNLEVASEFIEMAANLIYIKSVFLLPKNDEQEKLKDELTGMLIEYSACKLVAAKLKSMAEGVLFFVREPVEIELDNTYNIRHEPIQLAQAYHALIGKNSKKRVPRQEQFEEIVTAPVVSVSSRIVHVLRNLVSGKIKQLKLMFNKAGSRSENVATFLAVLELIRAGRVTIDENEEMAVNKVIARHERG